MTVFIFNWQVSATAFPASDGRRTMAHFSAPGTSGLTRQEGVKAAHRRNLRGQCDHRALGGKGEAEESEPGRPRSPGGGGRSPDSRRLQKGPVWPALRLQP